MQKWPNFFIVGAPRAGTSSLYAYLKKIDGVYMSPVAEPHYFSPVTADLVHLEKTREENHYLTLFKDAKSIMNYSNKQTHVMSLVNVHFLGVRGGLCLFTDYL